MKKITSRFAPCNCGAIKENLKLKRRFIPLNSAKGNLTGFTIIELLIVFAIIGLLSSIVLVYLKGTREKAKIAGALQFSASVHHALGDDIVGEWKFEGNFNNTSGNNNNGTGYGGITFVQNDASSELGKAANFDGVDDYVDLESDLISSKTITFSAWINEKSLGGSNTGRLTDNGKFLIYNKGTQLTVTSNGGTNYVYISVINFDT